MLKSYKQLSRWYGALEPETGSPVTSQPDDEATTAAPGSGEDEAPARYRGRPSTDPRPDDEPEWHRPPQNVPVELPAQRSEFVGGWSDWVVGHAPGPDDEYPVGRNADLVRFPWSDDGAYGGEYDEDSGARPLASPALRRRAKQQAYRELAARRGRAVVALIAAVLVLVVAAAAAVWLLHGSAGVGAASSPNLPSTADVRFTANSLYSGGDSSKADTACPTERDNSIVRGADAGSTDSGPDVVLAFQYAYYVERSAERARAVLAPNAAVAPVEAIQRGIDSVPAGTTHCVRVVRLGANEYSVEVTEYRPGGAAATYSKQTVGTTVIDGRTLITGIRAG
ncbi:hypothetical protein [Nocardia callitridis]|uniref:DUF8176 domain-containing protein n=1 Tax=Nocardia callitridis TaxID=648753 RepID=A0ABP9KCV1_9NOCA